MNIKPERMVLENGLRVLLMPNANSYSTTVAVIVATGSDYERKEESGISHFLEHMCFKGTKRRPRPIDIAAEFDGMGAEYNAFTSKEYTSYYAKVKADVWKQALDIVSDVYLNSTFDPGEIEKEKGVVIEEMHMYDDQPAEKVSDVFGALVYGDQPAGWRILGTEETVRGLNREKVVNYHGVQYEPKSTIVLVSGNFDSTDVRNEVSRLFSGLGTGKPEAKRPTREEQARPAEVIVSKDCDQTHLIIGFRAFPIYDERRFVLAVLANILGGGMSSRLFQKIREEMGAAYYVSMSTSYSSDRGIVAMSAGVQHAKLREVLSASLTAFREIKEAAVGEGELKKTKDHLIGNVFLSLESSEDIAYYFGRQEVYGMELRGPEWFAEQVSRVSAEDIRRVANELLVDAKLNFAVIGPSLGKSYLDQLSVE